jgi:hypothetical protein
MLVFNDSSLFIFLGLPTAKDKSPEGAQGISDADADLEARLENLRRQ